MKITDVDYLAFLANEATGQDNYYLDLYVMKKVDDNRKMKIRDLETILREPNKYSSDWAWLKQALINYRELNGEPTYEDFISLKRVKERRNITRAEFNELVREVRQDNA